MRAEQQVRLCANRLAQFFCKPFTKIERLQRQLPSVKRRIRPGRIKLQRSKPLRQILRCPLRRQNRIVVDVAFIARSWIDIGIGAQPLMHLPTEQFIDRLIRFFTNNIPARHFKRRQHTHQRKVGVLGKSTGIHAPPHRFDIVRIISRNIATEHILDHFGDQMRFEWHAIRFAYARHTGISRDFHKNKIAPAKMRRRIADDEGFDVGQFHCVRNPLIDLISRKSRTPNSPYSRPLPDCLYPPNGAM